MKTSRFTETQIVAILKEALCQSVQFFLQELFDAALERCNKEVIERNFSLLEAPTAGMREISDK